MWGLNELIDAKCFDVIVTTKNSSIIKYNLGDFLSSNFSVKWHNKKKATFEIKRLRDACHYHNNGMERKCTQNFIYSCFYSTASLCLSRKRPFTTNERRKKVKTDSRLSQKDWFLTISCTLCYLHNLLCILTSQASSFVK